MKEKWDIGERDIEFLKDVAIMEMGLVAQKWKMSDGAARAWLHRIRIRVTRCQNYVNRIRVLQKAYPRIRKFTTSGQLPEEEEEEKWQ
jgi:hypothetical protein